MNISPNKVVSLSYELNVDGAIVDSTGADQPLVFLYGAGQMIPGFEKGLNGLSSGDNYNFKVSAEDGYGESNPEEVIDISKEIFVVDGKLVDELQQGATMHMQDQHGNPLQGKVVTIGDSTVTMDFNHPLAGKELNFSGKIIDVREATEEEIDHGHVHGEGGHHH